PARTRVRQRCSSRAGAGRVGVHGRALRANARVRGMARAPARPSRRAARARAPGRPGAERVGLPRFLRRQSDAQPRLPRDTGPRRGGRCRDPRHGPDDLDRGRPHQRLRRRLRTSLPAHGPAGRALVGRRTRRRSRPPARRRARPRRVARCHQPLRAPHGPPRPSLGRPRPHRRHDRRGRVAAPSLRHRSPALRNRQRLEPPLRRHSVRYRARVGAGGRAPRSRSARPPGTCRNALGRVRTVPQGGTTLKRITLLLLALLTSLAFAGKGNDTLNVAFERTMLTFDTYATSERLTLILAHNFGDTLIHRNPVSGAFEPHLATAWRALDDLTFEFDLRTDVTFHNGEAFGPDDVVATLTYVITDGAELPGTGPLQWIDHVEAVDDDTVRIHAKSITPTAYESLALIGIIYPAGVLASEGAVALGQSPVGTGPYRFVGVDGNTIRFERFDDYFVGAKQMPAIANLVIHTLPEES